MKQDIEILQGTWKIVSLEMGGQQMPASALTDATITVKGKTFITSGMGATYEGAVELDPTRNPKTLDLLFNSGPEQGNKSLGIYELDPDTWRICLTTTRAERPRKFATEAGSGNALEILKRAATTPAQPSERGTMDRSEAVKTQSGGPTELEGEWSMVSGVSNGQPFDPMGVKYGKRVTKGNETTVLFGPQVYMKFKFTIDPSKNPKAIDYLHTQGPDQGKTQHGIYEIDGKTLKVCLSPVGQDRPADFSTKQGDGKMLTVWTLNTN